MTDKERIELNDLCGALADGNLSEAQRARLSHLLFSSEEARQHYVRAAALSASLFEYAGEMQAEAPDAAPVAGGGAGRIIRVRFRRMIPFAAAALVALSLTLASLWTQRNSEPSETGAEETQSVARISGTKDCRWLNGGRELGQELRAGDRLELVQGAAEITFDSGAQVALEGPASLDIESAWEAGLRRGSLKASVPPEAVGFRVTNPAVEVVDLGTEFSMVTDQNGDAEVFVLKGAVETIAPERTAGRATTPLVLREKQARRFARSGAADVPDRDVKFARFARTVSFDRIARPARFAHWSFDDAGERFRTPEVLGLPIRADAAALQSATNVDSLRGDGRWRGGLQLDGSATARVRVPGISERSSKSVAFWMRVPREAELSTAGSVLLWPLSGEGRLCSVSWNRNPVQGALGAIDTRIGRRHIIGSTPLRDGAWHHVAVITMPNPRNERGFQVKQYVDGRLEAVSGKYGVRRRPAIAPETALDLEADALQIGNAFRGELDELFVVDRALTPREVHSLMTRNTLADPELVASN